MEVPVVFPSLLSVIDVRKKGRSFQIKFDLLFDCFCLIVASCSNRIKTLFTCDPFKMKRCGDESRAVFFLYEVFLDENVKTVNGMKYR